MTELIAEEIARQRLDRPSMTVYDRLLRIIEELPAIGKTQRNEQQHFMFRGHDDVMNALNPLLAKWGVFIVPSVLERVAETRTTTRGSTMYEVNLHVRYTFWGLGGDSFTASGWGEGTDMGDKATSKAMTMAFKYVIGQVFALATEDTADPDGGSAEETRRADVAGRTVEAPTGNIPQPALKQAKAPKSYAEVNEWIAAYGADVVTAWPHYGAQAKAILGDGILQEDKDKVWRVTGRAAMYLVEQFDPNALPGPTLEDVAAAWQLALKEATGVDHELTGPEE